jgi:hypothetical protein
MPGKENFLFLAYLGTIPRGYFAFFGGGRGQNVNLKRQGKIWTKIVIMPGLCPPFSKFGQILPEWVASTKILGKTVQKKAN